MSLCRLICNWIREKRSTGKPDRRWNWQSRQRFGHSPVSFLPLVCLPVLMLFQLLAAGGIEAQSPSTTRVEAVRFWSFGDVTRIAIQTRGEYKFTSDQIEKPSRVYFDLNGLRPPANAQHGSQIIPVGDRRVKQIRVAEVSPGKTRIVLDLEGPAEVLSSQLVNPDRLMIEIRPKGTTLPALSLVHSTTGAQQINLAPDRSTYSPPPISVTRPGALSAVVPGSSARTTPPAPLASPVVASGTRTTGLLPPKNTLSALLVNGYESPGGTTTFQMPDGLILEKHDTPEQAAVPFSSSVPTPSRAKTVAVPPGLLSPQIKPAPAVSKTAGIAAPAKKDSAGDRSLVRVFGLKLGKVVIDPGHGGHDTGTIGPNGLMEKDLVLDVALRLGALITQQLAAQVVYTRADDTFIPLEDRTKLANDEKADLFISIHANSSPEPSATGVETYFFNLTSDKSGFDLATRENATSASSISDLNDLLHRAVLQTKLEESREFAQKIQSSLWESSTKMNSHSRDRGVRQAPFVVLIGATMPSILAEIGFVSNPHDEKLLRRNDQRERIAEALFKGVSQYASSLSHLQIARVAQNSAR